MGGIIGIMDAKKRHLRLLKNADASPLQKLVEKFLATSHPGQRITTVWKVMVPIRRMSHRWG